MTNNTAPARKVRVTAQSVAFTMLMEGATGVRNLHSKPGHEIAPATFDSAVDLLASDTEKQSQLAALREELIGSDEPGERGRPAAKVGESRTYKAQRVGDGDAFIRLPVSLLNAGKGEGVRVTFGQGVITVTLA